MRLRRGRQSGRPLHFSTAGGYHSTGTWRAVRRAHGRQAGCVWSCPFPVASSPEVVPEGGTRARNPLAPSWHRSCWDLDITHVACVAQDPGVRSRLFRGVHATARGVGMSFGPARAGDAGNRRRNITLPPTGGSHGASRSGERCRARHRWPRRNACQFVGRWCRSVVAERPRPHATTGGNTIWSHRPLAAAFRTRATRRWVNLPRA